MLERYSAAAQSRIVWGVLTGAVFLFSVIVLRGVRGAELPLLLTGILFLAPQIYLTSFELVITDDEIVYRQYFVSRRIRRGGVESAKLEYALLDSNLFKPPMRLVLTLKPTAGSSPLMINARVFSPKLVRRVKEIVLLDGGRVLE